MFRILIILLSTALAVSESTSINTYSPALLIANETGVFYQNLTTGATKTIIPYYFGATYVDYNGDKEIFAILMSPDPLYRRIVRVETPYFATPHNACNTDDLPQWCRNDEYCIYFCVKTENPTLFEIIKPADCMFASNLVVDWKHSNIYWSCKTEKYNNYNSIRMATTEGKSERQWSIIEDSAEVLDMKIDPYARKLFWLEQKILDKTLRLKRSNLNMENVVHIFDYVDTSDIRKPKLVLDIHNQKIYLARNKDSLVRMNYEGSAVTPVDPTLMIESSDLRKNNVTRSTLYHPLLQSPELKCPKHSCSDVCQLITWKGMECYNDGRNITVSDKRTFLSSTQTTIIDETGRTTSDIYKVNETVITVPTSSNLLNTCHLAMIFYVATTVISFSSFLFGFIIGRKVTKGNYRPTKHKEYLHSSM